MSSIGSFAAISSQAYLLVAPEIRNCRDSALPLGVSPDFPLVPLLYPPKHKGGPDRPL